MRSRVCLLSPAVESVDLLICDQMIVDLVVILQIILRELEAAARAPRRITRYQTPLLQRGRSRSPAGESVGDA